MALLFVRDTEGKEHLVHSSIFDTMKVVDVDEKRPARAIGSWDDVWDRIESNGDER